MSARPVTLAALVLVASVAGGCGLPSDSSPKEISAEALPPDLSASSTVPDPTGDPNASIFLVRTTSDGKQVLEERAVELAPTADEEERITAALERLIASTPQDDELASLVPSSLLVRAVNVVDDVVRIDFEGLDQITGEGQGLAIAQIVFTVLELEEDGAYRGVVVLNEGKEAEVRVGEGRVAAAGQAIDQFDFAELLIALRVSRGEIPPPPTEPSTTTTVPGPPDSDPPASDPPDSDPASTEPDPSG